MNKKIKIAIDIDYILRDSISSLINIYKKQVNEEWNGDLSSINDTNDLYTIFPFPKYEYIEKKSIDDEEILENIIIVDEDSELEPNLEYFNKFVIDNILEIYGYAKESIPNIFLFLNEYIKNNQNVIELTLFSKIRGKGIAATHFFLSKCSSEIKNIQFITEDSELRIFDEIISYKDIIKSLVKKNRLTIFKTPFNHHLNQLCELSTDLKKNLNLILNDYDLL